MEFKFKKFTVTQKQSAMKVGTDGVLLGAWAPIAHDPYSMLDIGTGTGLIALMLAQRCEERYQGDTVQIEALEIDENAYVEAVGNFEESPWNNSLFCFHASLDAFMDELEDEEYDLIVCNPPFYTENVTSGNDSRDLARQNSHLPFSDLIAAAGVLLSDEGVFCVIIPFKEELNFILMAESEGLYASKITRVKGSPDTEIKRSLMAFSRLERATETDELIIETRRGEFTPSYISLTKDFYLKM